ncbi:50S ribosomal protein L18, partial [Salibacterium salarium]
SASTLENDIKLENGGNKEAAQKIGEIVAKRASEKGYESVVFDRGGFVYHGRVQALADAARENGLNF